MAITVKDANNVDRIFKTTIVGSEHIAHYNIDSLPPLVAGTANIGDVDVLTLPSIPAGNNNIGNVDVETLPPIPTGSNTIGNVGIGTGTNNIGHTGGVEYEAVAASQTTQALGATGAVGDYLSHLTITPTSTSPGAVSIKDGSNTAIEVFAGGASSVTTLHPFTVVIGAKSVQGAWQITTGSAVKLIAFGDFT